MSEDEKNFSEPAQEGLGEAQEKLDPRAIPEPEPEKEPDPGFNFQIPIAVARIAWPHDTVAADQYVNTVAPILDLIEFHKCLGPMGDLPPTVRLIIGSAAIIGGVVLIKVGQRPKKGVAHGKKETKQTVPEQAEAQPPSELPGPPEGKTGGNGPKQQVAPGHRENEANNQRFFSALKGKQ